MRIQNIIMKTGHPNDLMSFFIYKLEKIYAIQKYLNDTLPFMVWASSSKELTSALEAHQHVTYRQISRLNAIFDELLIIPKKRHPRAVKKMIKSAKRQIKGAQSNYSVLDTALTITWRGIDHLNIAAYAGLISLSSLLAFKKVSQSLYMAMEEEMEADTRLRDISGSRYYYAVAEKESSIG